MEKSLSETGRRVVAKRIVVDNLDGTEMIVENGTITRVPKESNILILEGPLKWVYHEEGWSIGDTDVLGQIWAKWAETYHSEGPHGSFRITIERLE